MQTICIFRGPGLTQVKPAGVHGGYLVSMSFVSFRDAAPPRAARVPASVFFSAGFRPFFLLAGIWAAIAVPLWLAAYAHGYAVGGALPAMVWHAHEMIYGF